jgi:LysM repeat protein
MAQDSPMTDEREGIPHAWRMVGAVGLSSMMAATGIFLLGGTDSSASAPTNSANGAPSTARLAPVATAATKRTRLTITTTTSTPTITTNTAQKAAACTKHYVVRGGDSWSLIASEANMSLDALLTLNHAATSTALQPGQQLCIPASASVVVTTAAPVTTTKRTVWVPPATAAPAPVYTPVARSGGS